MLFGWALSGGGWRVAGMPFKSTLPRVARPFALVHFAVRTLHISLGCWSVLGARRSDDSAAFRAASVLCLRVGTVFRIPYLYMPKIVWDPSSPRLCCFCLPPRGGRTRECNSVILLQI